MNNDKTGYIKSTSNILFTFGESDEVYIDTFIDTINNLNLSLALVTEKIEPKAKFELKIKSINKGSFLAFFGLDISSLPNLLLSPVALAAYIITIWSGVIKIKNHLKGEKPISITRIGDNYNIVNIYNQIVVSSREEADMYFKNTILDNSLTNMANAIYRDKHINHLTISSDEEKLNFTKEELQLMSKRIIEVSENKMTYNIDVDLQLKKPDLLGDSKWQFVFNKVIDADMFDENFKEMVHKRKVKNLYAGVKIPVKLLVEQDVDENGILIPDTERYSISKVTGDIIEPNEPMTIEEM